MANDILVFCEARNGAVTKASREALSKARELAGALSGAVVALALGPGLDAELPTLGKFGAARVRHGDDPRLAAYTAEGYARVIAAEAKALAARAVLMPATAMGKDLAPRVAAHLETAPAVDCTGVAVVDGAIEAVRPVYAGNATRTVRLEGVAVVSLRPNSFAISEAGSDAPVETFAADPGEVRDAVLETKKPEGGALDVAEAERIVTGGRGLGDNENYERLIMPLAKLLGAANGATRALVDDGWRPHGEQVGQTGKVVSPTLYVACGLSGAIQHLAGMRTSKCIVAVNKDPEAPIFKVADYGIVGDVNEVLPALTEKLGALLAD